MVREKFQRLQLPERVLDDMIKIQGLLTALSELEKATKRKKQIIVNDITERLVCALPSYSLQNLFLKDNLLTTAVSQSIIFSENEICFGFSEPFVVPIKELKKLKLDKFCALMNEVNHHWGSKENTTRKINGLAILQEWERRNENDEEKEVVLFKFRLIDGRYL